MNDKKKRFISDLRGLAESHRNTADAMEAVAKQMEDGDLSMNDFLSKLREEDQRAYLEVVP